jgi:hypothetical protein
MARLACESEKRYVGAGSRLAKCRRSDGYGTHFYRSLAACSPGKQCYRAPPAFPHHSFGEKSMNLKLVAAISLFAAVPMVAFAQKDGDANKAPKPSVADVQKLVQMISADKAKLKAYCDIGKLQDEMEKADQKKDNKALEALGTKADTLAQQIGPEYTKVMDGLEEVDPNSAEGKQYTTAFAALVKQCK